MTEENYNYRTSTITVLNGSGKIPTTTLKNSPATVLCYHRTSACIWKWRPEIIGVQDILTGRGQPQ